MKKYVKLYEEFIKPTHPGLITDPAQVTKWIEENLVGKKDEYGISRIKEGSYKIDSNGVVDVDGNVHIHKMNLEYIPIQFGKVIGSFTCTDNQLISLVGAPNEVGGNFWCGYNQLTSIVGAPNEVGGAFSCSGNQLTSLVGAPSYVGDSFYCNNNHLTSLVGAPNEVGGIFGCWNNFLCINEPYEIDHDNPNPGHYIKDLELIAQRFQEKVKDHPNKVEICKSVLNRPDLVEMFIRYDVTEVTQYFSDDVKDIANAALKGNHKLR